MLMGNCGCGCGCSEPTPAPACGCGCKGVITDGISIQGNGCTNEILRGYRIEPLDGNFVVTRPDGTMYTIKPGDRIAVGAGGNSLIITHSDGTTETIALHPAASLTKVQDVDNRVTFNAATQVLNIPPAMAAKVSSLALDCAAGYLAPARVTGMVNEFSTVAGMGGNDAIIIPRNGRYNISAGWGTDSVVTCPAFSLIASVGINGLWAGRFTAPNNDVAGLADQVSFHLPGTLLHAGDIITLGAFTDCNDPALKVGAAYLAAEYIEGT